MKKILVTGSGGLVGGEVAKHFLSLGWKVFGIDDDHRARFFGPSASTKAFVVGLMGEFRDYNHFVVDITDVERVAGIVKKVRPDAIVHAAAQPSHDRAATIPFLDFDVNARATLGLLEAARSFCPEAPFVFLSTNKVYGDAPNDEPITELNARYEWSSDWLRDNGWGESGRIDRSTHSLFGCSKVAADLYVQEYGRYFGMPTVCLRAGCLTGGVHAGAILHGFLSYLAKCFVTDTPYTVYGYKGKQVRDNLHAGDVASFCEQFIASPRKSAVYNIGGGKANSCSVIEAMAALSSITGKALDVVFSEKPRIGDHVCYYSDLRSIKADYQAWSVSRDLSSIYEELIQSWTFRQTPASS